MSKWSIVLNNTLSAKLNPPIELDQTHRYSITLVNGELNYSWYNISADKGNNTYDVSGTPQTVPDGVWSSCDLQKYLQDKHGDIKITPLYYSGQWNISTSNGATFGTGTLGPIIGFQINQTLPPDSSTTGPNAVSFTQDVSSINVSCNLVDNTHSHHNASNSNILMTTGLPIVDPYAKIRLITANYIPVQLGANGIITSISLRLLNQDLKRIKLTDNNTNFWIQIEDAGRIESASKPVSSL